MIKFVCQNVYFFILYVLTNFIFRKQLKNRDFKENPSEGK